MKRFFIALNSLKDKDHVVTDSIRRVIEENGGMVTGEFSDLSDARCRDLDAAIPPETECLIVLGGDGTLLRTARYQHDKGLPLLGINLGHLGYLTEGDRDSARDVVEHVIAGRYVIEERMMLQGSVIRNGETICGDLALNDITVTRSRSLKTIDFDLYVNDNFLYNYTADGMLVSTPTGSTAYNLSCGGPIAEPTAELFLITPISPHSLNNRSMILSPQDCIELVISDTNVDPDVALEYCAYFDGDSCVQLCPGDRISIVRSPEVTRILKLSHRSFLDILKKKMT